MLENIARKVFHKRPPGTPSNSQNNLDETSVFTFPPCPPLAPDCGDSGEEDEKNEDEEPEAMVHHARGLAVPQCKTNPDSDTEGTFCADNYEEIQEEDESDDDELVHCEGPAALRRSGNRAGFSSPIWALHGTMIPGRHFSKSSSASCNTGALAPH